MLMYSLRDTERIWTQVTLVQSAKKKTQVPELLIPDLYFALYSSFWNLTS